MLTPSRMSASTSTVTWRRWIRLEEALVHEVAQHDAEREAQHGGQEPERQRVVAL